MNNGEWSERIDISRGCKQGNLISSINFTLAIEVIALKIRQNPKIKGIEIKNLIKKLSQYADDMWTSSQYDEVFYVETIRQFQLFEMFTSLKINYNKTAVLRIGSLRKTDASFYTTLSIASLV